jgi:hypothetical protein
MLNSQDTEILRQARLARFRSFVITNLDIVIRGCCLTLQGADPGIAIAKADTLLYQAAIILGTTKLQILDKNSNLVFTAELKSEYLRTKEEAMTATAERAVEFELSPSAATPSVVPWNRITDITGEKEEQLRDRLKALSTPFYWAEETWGVDEHTASQLIIDFRMKQAQGEVEMLFSKQLDGKTAKSVASKPKSDEETNGRKPKAEKTEKPEFAPLKRGATATLEKYLKFIVGDDKERQMEILGDIADEGTKGKRHVNKILNSYPDDIAKPKASEFYVAASRLMAKRDKVQEPEEEKDKTTEQTEQAIEQ